MSCLLGVVDSRISHEEKLSWDTNKIGGNVISADLTSFSHPSCPLCGRPLVLVVQLYCPLEFSTYHRVLYVFACGNQQCWNKSESWQVYRCQAIDHASVKAREPQRDTKPKPAADDWGIADTDDWGADGADDWGTEAADQDDWGIEGSIDKTTGINDIERTMTDGSTERLTSSTETAQPRDIADEMPLQQMNLHNLEPDNDNDTNDNNANDNDIADNDTNDSHIIPEDAFTVKADRDRLKSLCKTKSSTESSCTIIPYYLNVFDEPANQDEDSSHVTKLLRDYEKKEGFRVNDADYSEEHGKKGQGEGYEKTSVYHKDLTFHKFMKRVALCPQQCIRYEWNGTPLLMRQLPPHDHVTRCQHCSGETVFEFQLMPALVNYLKTDDTSGVAVEFGTVLVFSCKQSCWEDGSGFRSEWVIVQADPDQDLFS